MKKLLTITLVGIACWVQARLVKTWTQAELTTAADAVVVIEAVSTEKTDLEPDFLQNTHLSKADYQAWVTTFKVLTVFKGSVDAGKPLKIVHFTYSDRVHSSFNGAQFVKFTIGPVEREETVKVNGVGQGTVTWTAYRPTWLAYLKQSKDGRFEPVTGHYDAVPSFYEQGRVQSAFH